MYTKTHLCLDRDDLIEFLNQRKPDIISVRKIHYEGADKELYTYEVIYK